MLITISLSFHQVALSSSSLFPDHIDSLTFYLLQYDIWFSFCLFQGKRQFQNHFDKESSKFRKGENNPFHFFDKVKVISSQGWSSGFPDVCLHERIKSFGCLRNNMILYPLEFDVYNNISAFRIVHLFYLKAFSDFLILCPPFQKKSHSLASLFVGSPYSQYLHNSNTRCIHLRVIENTKDSFLRRHCWSNFTGHLSAGGSELAI